MKLKYSLSVNDVTYNDKILDVSSIDLGVNELGIGYVSDITVKLVYDESLLDTVNKEAILVLQYDDNKINYKGIIRKVTYRENTITLNISHSSSVKQFKEKWHIYGSQGTVIYTECDLIDVDDSDLSNQAIYLAEFNSTDFSIVNTNSYYLFNQYIFDPSTALKIDNQIAVVFFKNLLFYVDSNNNLYGDGIDITHRNGQWGQQNSYVQFKNPANADEILKVEVDDRVTVYGVKKLDNNNNYVEDDLSTYKYVDPNLYSEVKLVYNSTVYGALPFLRVLRNTKIDKEHPDKLPVFVTINNNISNPEDVIEDILLKNGFTVRKKRKDTNKNIILSFRQKKNSKDMIEQICKEAFVYVIPTLNDKFDIVSTDIPSSETFFDTDFIINSYQITQENKQIDDINLTIKTAVLPATDKILPKQEVFYAASNTANNVEDVTIELHNYNTEFKTRYIDYQNKRTYLEFEVPLTAAWLNVEVGDVVTVYSLNNKFNRYIQILQKTIYKNKIYFKGKHT